MGLIADIYRNRRGDFSNGGISGKADQVVIVNLPGPFEPDEDTPAVRLVRGNIPGTVKIVPAVKTLGGGWTTMYRDGEKTIGPMAGGCYVATSDSRFRDACRMLGADAAEAVSLHDRFETPAHYDMLTR